jgi:hypothetical protein
MKTNIKKIEAEYKNWLGNWIHFSKAPYLKINPSQFHNDPSGIYLFPESFEPVGHWDTYPYKFVVEVPSSLRVLDLAKMSRQQAIDFVEHHLGPLDEDDKKKLETVENYQDRVWEMVWNSSKFLGKPAKWNKALRDLGYDAVFDDTGSIHNSEVQLIVLDPRKIKIVQMITQSDSGYEDVLFVMEHVVRYLKPHGKVEVSVPKKIKKYGETKIQGDIIFETDSSKLHLIVYPSYRNKDDLKPYAINVSVSYSEPSLGMGAGAEFSRTKRSFDEIEKNLDWVLKKIL